MASENEGPCAFLFRADCSRLRFVDCTPQLGIYWYLFVEMFEHFYELFIWVFQLLLASLVVAMLMRFYEEPVFLCYTILLITNVLQPYHSIGEFGYLIALLPVWGFLQSQCRLYLPTICILLASLVLTPLFHYMWLQPGTANANFYFAACMVYAVGQIFLITDMLNSFVRRDYLLRVGSKLQLSSGQKLILLDCQSRPLSLPPECAPSPRTVARSHCVRPSSDRFRPQPPIDEVDQGTASNRSTSELPRRRSYPISHPPSEVPFCASCRQQDEEMLAASEEKSPSPTGVPPLEDEDASRSWIFKQLPGPWWWCEDCQASVSSPQITIPHLFAVLRQWTPYAQLQLITVVEEIFRRGAHVDDRDGLTDMTLLHFAAKSGAVGDEESACRIAEFLLNGGANLEARCRWTDMTPLHYAAYFDCPMLVELFIQRGAQLEARSSLADEATPLHLCAIQLSLGAARVLLHASVQSLAQAGVRYAGKDALDALGRTPYDCLPPVTQLAEPLCSLRDRLAELLGSPTKDRPAGFPIGTHADYNVTTPDGGIMPVENGTYVSTKPPYQPVATAPSLENAASSRQPTPQPDGLSWLVAESGYLSPRNRRSTASNSDSISPPPTRPATAPASRQPHVINHPLPSTSSVSAKVTLQALGLSLDDRVCIGPGSSASLNGSVDRVSVNGRIGRLRYCGPVGFASGVWVGVELDQPLGRNNGTVSGVQYFSCAPNYGIFAPIGRVYKAVSDGGATQKWRPIQGKLPSSAKSPSMRSSAQKQQVGATSDEDAASSTDTSLRIQSSTDGSDTQQFQLGDRVLVAGQRRGVIRYIGSTEFAPGTWYGIELDQPLGKNNGSVAGVRYFQCPVGHGIFASVNRIQRLPNRPGTPQISKPIPFKPNTSMSGSWYGDPVGSDRLRTRTSWSTTTSPMIGRAVVGRPSLPAELVNALTAAGHGAKQAMAGKDEPAFYITEGMQVLCSGEMGIVRYIGPITFADGIWLGIELRKPRGRHDGSVAGKRYFNCRPGHGLLVRPSRVFCRGINAVNLLPPALAAIERELAEKRQANSSKASQSDSTDTGSRSSSTVPNGEPNSVSS
ncbi:phosphatidylinositol glycan class U [Clonorchis sinensis]|uniref:Phosphatidylinositol glycan class U n=1 Tax=Clonorchis sinensis TaxID=79923 RepID=H2KRA0_CLOSI|nr:phosphatidylinositol glycan class U [Clonorchis sinensis]